MASNVSGIGGFGQRLVAAVAEEWRVAGDAAIGGGEFLENELSDIDRRQAERVRKGIPIKRRQLAVAVMSPCVSSPSARKKRA